MHSVGWLSRGFDVVRPTAATSLAFLGRGLSRVLGPAAAVLLLIVILWLALWEGPQRYAFLVEGLSPKERLDSQMGYAEPWRKY